MNGKTVSQNEYFFKPFKEMPFAKPTIKTEISQTGNGFNIRLSSDKVARDVYLSGLTEGFFADNYFDLIPGRDREIEFRANQKMSADEFRKLLKVRSLADAF
jgi:beta-mannosidase